MIRIDAHIRQTVQDTRLVHVYSFPVRLRPAKNNSTRSKTDTQRHRKEKKKDRDIYMEHRRIRVYLYKQPRCETKC